MCVLHIHIASYAVCMERNSRTNHRHTHSYDEQSYSQSSATIHIRTYSNWHTRRRRRLFEWLFACGSCLALLWSWSRLTLLFRSFFSAFAGRTFFLFSLLCFIVFACHAFVWASWRDVEDIRSANNDLELRIEREWRVVRHEYMSNEWTRDDCLILNSCKCIALSWIFIYENEKRTHHTHRQFNWSTVVILFSFCSTEHSRLVCESFCLLCGDALTMATKATEMNKKKNNLLQTLWVFAKQKQKPKNGFPCDKMVSNAMALRDTTQTMMEMKNKNSLFLLCNCVGEPNCHNFTFYASTSVHCTHQRTPHSKLLAQSMHIEHSSLDLFIWSSFNTFDFLSLRSLTFIRRLNRLKT